MFCPKCGTDMKDEKACLNCGFVINETRSDSSIVFAASAKDVVTNKAVPLDKSSTISVPKLIIFSLIAIVLLYMFFDAAAKVSDGGLGIMDIQSVGGKTLEEAYYFELGNIYGGYAMAIRALGVFFASVSIWLGLKK